MSDRIYLKGFYALFFFCFLHISVIAEPIIWEGKPISPDEDLLSGLLTINIENGFAKGEISGLSAKGEIDRQSHFTLSFLPEGTQDLSAKAGTFKGYITKANELRGHWVRYGMQVRASVPYATPIHFSKRGHRYKGIAAPLSDELSLFLVGTPKAANRYDFTVFIPEINAGRLFSHSVLELGKNRATWFSESDESKEEVAAGVYAPDSGTFNLELPYGAGNFHFQEQATDTRGLVAALRTEEYRIPIKKNDGWPVDNADKLGVSSKVLEQFGNMLSSEPAKTPQEAQTEALLVARNGVLVFERYFRGYDAEEPHDLRSASKSLTGILPGLIEQANLLGQNKQQSLLNTPIYQTLGFNTDDPKKQAITLEHALSMSTGLDCDDNQQGSPGGEGAMQDQQKEPDWFRYILRLDAVYEPGSHTAYCSGGINLAGAVLTAKTQQWMPMLIEELFARPLGIKKYHINLLPDGQQAYSGGGLHITARDFLKMGQLLLNKGRWGEQQLLSPDYVDSVLTPRGEMFGDGYGLGWWLRTYEVDGHSYRTFYAGGNGGQQIMAVPELDMIVVSLGSAYGTRGTIKMIDDWFPNVILKNAILKKVQ